MKGDLEGVTDGGSMVRFIIGAFGAGKTFFMHLIRSMALEMGMVTMHADLTPDRRLHGTAGQARSLYAELARNISTRTHPDGGAMRSIVERFISSACQEADVRGLEASAVIEERLEHLSELLGGYDFVRVIRSYYHGHEEGSEVLQERSLRWLRGEYATKDDARRDLGVRVIITDGNWYDSLKLLAQFTRAAGYHGLVVGLDEMVNLYKLAHTGSRKSNYEQVLRILNDCLQGNVEGLGFLMCGTPEFLADTRRGLYSYEALRTRLAENQFAKNGFQDLSGPVIRLENLTQEELYVLLDRVRSVFSSGDEISFVLPDAALMAFMEHCSARIGAAYFQTPRNVVRAFVHLFDVLHQNPGATWQGLMGEVDIPGEANPDLEPLGLPTHGEGAAGEDDELTSLRV